MKFQQGYVYIFLEDELSRALEFAGQYFNKTYHGVERKQ